MIERPANTSLSLFLDVMQSEERSLCLLKTTWVGLHRAYTSRFTVHPPSNNNDCHRIGRRDGNGQLYKMAASTADHVHVYHCQWEKLVVIYCRKQPSRQPKKGNRSVPRNATKNKYNGLCKIRTRLTRASLISLLILLLNNYSLMYLGWRTVTNTLTYWHSIGIPVWESSHTHT